MGRHRIRAPEIMCPYNAGVMCDEPTKCKKCGFSNAEYKKRVARIRADLFESEKEKACRAKRLIDASILDGVLADRLKCGDDRERLSWMRAQLADQEDADAAFVVHARWEERGDAFGYLRCSNCRDCNIYGDWPDGVKWKYCPQCGAKMDVDEVTT